MRVTRRACIAGRVQGVGYRDALRREALARGIAGWVRNRRDGTVETVLQGDAAAVDALLAWARRGPPAARVDRVEVRDVQETGGGELDRRYAGFEQLPTA